MRRVWLGFDPGGRETGVVLRCREELVGHTVAVRRDDLDVPDGAYCRQVAADALALLDAAGLHPRHPSLVVVSEDVRYWPPRARGHVCPACRRQHNPAVNNPRNLTGVLGAAVVHGSVLARWADTVVVPPGSGHGRLHASAYPRAIRPPGKGGDLLRHCRSAWDGTHHGETLHRRRGA